MKKLIKDICQESWCKPEMASVLGRSDYPHSVSVQIVFMNDVLHRCVSLAAQLSQSPLTIKSKLHHTFVIQKLLLLPHKCSFIVII